MKMIGVKPSNKISFLMGLLKSLVGRKDKKGPSLYRISQMFDVPRSTVYYWDKHPDRIPMGAVDMVRAEAGLTWSEVGEEYSEAIKAARKAAEKENEEKVEAKKKRKKE